MKTTDYPALTELAERERALESARQKVTELEAENRKAQRAVERAASALNDYFRALVQGDRREDPEEEARLQDAVTAAQAGTVTRVVEPHHMSELLGTVARLEVTNPKLEGMLAGARELVEKREQELRAFKARRFDDLTAEIIEQAGPARGAMQEALDALSVAGKEWRRVADLWRPLQTSNVRMESPLRELPSSVFESVPLPVPASMLPEGEPAGSDVPLISPRAELRTRPRTRKRSEAA